MVDDVAVDTCWDDGVDLGLLAGLLVVVTPLPDPVVDDENMRGG